MANKTTGVFVGIYAQKSDAEADYGDVKTLHDGGAIGFYDAAVITKDTDGRVHVNKDELTTRHGALVGGLLSILFPPALLVNVAAGALIGHLWRGLSRADMKDLGETLDSGEVALVVVAELKLEETFANEFSRANRRTEKHLNLDSDELGEAIDAELGLAVAR